jgi:hypothetical protein
MSSVHQIALEPQQHCSQTESGRIRRCAELINGSTFSCGKNKRRLTCKCCCIRISIRMTQFSYDGFCAFLGQHTKELWQLKYFQGKYKGLDLSEHCFSGNAYIALLKAESYGTTFTIII